MLVLIVVLLSFSYRLSLLDRTTFNSWDEAEYALLSNSVLDGHYALMGEPFKLHPPLFAMLNAAVRSVSTSGLIAYRSVSAVLGAVAALGVYVLGEKLKKNAGLYACLLLCTSPFFFQFSSRAFSDVTLSFFMLASLHAHITRSGAKWLVIMAAALTKLNSIAVLLIMSTLDVMDRERKLDKTIYISYVGGYLLWKAFSLVDSVRLGESAVQAIWGYNWLAEGVGLIVPESSRNGFLFYLGNLDFVSPYFTILFFAAFLVLIAKKRNDLLATLTLPLLFLTLWSVRTPRYFVQFMPILVLPVGVALSLLGENRRFLTFAVLLLVASKFSQETAWMGQTSKEWLDTGAYVKENTSGALLSTSPMETALYADRDVLVPYTHTLEQFVELERDSRWIVIAKRYEGDFKEIHEYVNKKGTETVQQLPFYGIRVMPA